MITVRVRYVGILAAYVGAQSRDVCLPGGATVEQLVLHLAEAGPESLRSILLHKGKPNSLVRIVRNQAQVEWQTPVADADEILILTSIAGG